MIKKKIIQNCLWLKRNPIPHGRRLCSDHIPRTSRVGQSCSSPGGREVLRMAAERILNIHVFGVGCPCPHNDKSQALDLQNTDNHPSPCRWLVNAWENQNPHSFTPADGRLLVSTASRKWPQRTKTLILLFAPTMALMPRIYKGYLQVSESHATSHMYWKWQTLVTQSQWGAHFLITLQTPLSSWRGSYLIPDKFLITPLEEWD